MCVCVWWCNGLLTDAAIGQQLHRLWHPVWTYNKHGFVFKLKALRSISVTNGTGLGKQQIWDMFTRYATHPWSRSHNMLWRRIEAGITGISRAPFSWMTDGPFSCVPFCNSSTVGRIHLWRDGEFLIPCFISVGPSVCWSPKLSKYKSNFLSMRLGFATRVKCFWGCVHVQTFQNHAHKSAPNPHPVCRD